MKRREFIKAGLGGMALSLAPGASRALSADAAGSPADDGKDVVVVGVDGTDFTPANLDGYQRGRADVWQCSGNVMDDKRFQDISDFPG